MTYKILMDDTRRIIHRSNIRSAADPNARNLCLDLLNDKPPEIIWSLCKASPALDHAEDSSLHSSMEPPDENPERSFTGENEWVINSSTQPHSKLHKRHNALSFHHVHEAIASGYIVLTYQPGKFNPADIFCKHWGYQTIWPILKPILFFHGDTADLIQDDDTA
jgi:hypothetical protein